MKCAIINSSQLAATGRWDAAYNIVWQKNQSAVAKLQKAFSQPELLALALKLPFNKEAHRAIARGSKTTVSTDWISNLKYADLALYVVLSWDPKVVQKVRTEHQTRIDELDAIAVKLAVVNL